MKCAYCGAEFIAKTTRAKYCSRECNDNAHKEKMRAEYIGKREHVCRLCGKELPKYKSYFCSNDCKSRFHNIKSGKITHNKELVKTCVVCGKQFTTWHSAFVTCSDECRERYKRPYDPERERARYIKIHPGALTAEERNKKRHEEHLKRVAKQSAEQQVEKAKREAKRAQKEAEKEKRKQENIEYWQHYEAEHACAHCGKTFIAHYPTTKYCSDKCQSKMNRKKRRYKGITVDSDISLFKLAERDQDRCQICGQLVDWDDFVKTDKATICGNMYPSIDHIIPISVGGLHSWDNIQLAHRICNTRKNNKVI